MQNREIPGNADSSSHLSPGTQSYSPPVLPQPGIVVEPTTRPPVGTLQAVPNPGPTFGGIEPPAWQQLLQILKSPPSAQQQQQVLAILKSDPKLMAAFIRQRAFQNQAQQRQQRGVQPTAQAPVGASQVLPNPGPSIGDMQGSAEESQQILQALESLALL